jgi:hypothetical protein
MAYDERLVGRIRELVGDQPGLTEQKMFGGLAFLIDGHQIVGITVLADTDRLQRFSAIDR